MGSPKEEMEDFWGAVFGEPPPIDADFELLAQLIVRFSTLPPPYRLDGREPRPA